MSETPNESEELSHQSDLTPALDPAVVDYIKDTPFEDMLVEMDGSAGGGKQGEFVQVLREWLPDSEDYRSKTYLHPQQVYALSLLRNISAFHKDLEPLQPVMNDVIDNLERYALSMDAHARNQHSDEIRSMFGDRGELTAGEKDSMLMNLIGGNNENDE